MNNLGSMSLVIFAYFLKTMFVFMIMYPLSKINKIWKKRFLKIKRDLYFKNFYSIIFEAYFNIGLCSILNLNAKMGDRDKNMTNTLISIVSLAVLIIFVPGSLVYLLIQPIRRIYGDNKFHRKWSKAYEDLNLRNQFNRLYRILFCLRRLMFLGCVHFLIDYPA